MPLVQLRWLTRAMQIAAIGAGSIYLMWPTTMQYPPLTGDGLSSQVLGWLIGIDSPQNCFPSLHAGLTLLTVWAIAVRRQTVITTVSLVWALAIAIAILQLRRHLFIDLVGGVLLAGGSGWLAMYIDAGKKQHREIRYE
ncbi:PAP2 superfamily protein [compost metagenome]